MQLHRGVRAGSSAGHDRAGAGVPLPAARWSSPCCRSTPSRSLSWPPDGLHAALVVARRADNAGARDALSTSLKMALWRHGRSRWCSARWPSFAVQRFQFFGRETLSLLIVLPIALPGIVTGIALNAAFRQVGYRARVRSR